MKSALRLLAYLPILHAASSRADNDSFSQATNLNAVTLPHITFVGGTGTAEPGEPAHAGSPAAHSFWYTWKATATTACIFREFISGNDARIAIYTGSSVTGLTLVAQGRQRVFFPVTDGTVYQIAIDSPAADVIQFKPYPLGGSDEIENATPITGDFPRLVEGNNALATAAKTDEDWHPEFHPTATVWWVWTAPSNGAVRMDARYCDFGLRLSTYERAPSGDPVRVSAGFETTGMTVTAGNDYLFCIDTTGDPGQIGFWMEWFPTTPPPNDNLVNATDLGSPLIACDGGWIHYATVEPGAPHEQSNPFFPERTLWWKWTAPVTSAYRFSQHGSDGYSIINIYAGAPSTGNIVAGLDDRNGVRIPATAGTTYWIQIIDWRHTSYRAEINIHPAHTETSYFTYLSDRGIFRLYGAQRHPDADPDGDALSNQLEFACGTNPELHDLTNSNRPRLLPDGTGWKLQWSEDTSYTRPSSLNPVSLTGKTSLTLTGPWATPPWFSDSPTGQKFIHLPSSDRAFSRLELHDPNWIPGP